MNRNVAIVLCLLIALFGMPMSAYSHSSVTQPVQASLYFTPAQTTLPPDTTFRLMLDAKSFHVAFIRIELAFNPAKIKLASEIQNDRAPFRRIKSSTSMSVANTSGRIVMVLAQDIGDTAPTGTFELALLRFRLVTNTPKETAVLKFLNQNVQIVSSEATVIPFVSIDSTFRLNPDLIFRYGFESGNLNGWTGMRVDDGDLSVNSNAALTGIYGMQAVLDDNNPLFVVDNRPQAEKLYRARFYFDPNSISMVSGNAHHIFLGYNSLSVPILITELRSFTGSYQVRVGLRTDANTWKVSNWIRISDARHAFEIAWWAASGVGLNNGRLAFWLDGIRKADITGVDNDTHRLETVQLGVIGVDDGTRGTYYFDAFEARNQTYVGLVPEIPANDNFHAAAVIPTLPFNRTQSTRGSSSEREDPRASCWDSGGNVWYRYVAPADSLVRFDTTASNYDTWIAVFTNTNGIFTEVGCNEIVNGETIARTDVAITAGTTYYILIGGDDRASGTLILRAQLLP